MAIATRLIETREALGLNQRQLCKATGIATNTYNQWEKGSRPGLEGAFALCDELGYTLDWIYHGDDSRLPTQISDQLREARNTANRPPRRAKGGRG